jgi:hypothetical protein
MIERMRTGEIRFPEIRVSPADIHKVRGYFANQFRHLDLLHNHRPGGDRFFYRYPAVQFKIDDHLAVLGFQSQGIEVLKELFLNTGEIQIEGRRLAVRDREIEVKEEPFGEDGETHAYEFVTPWIALNQENFADYQSLANDRERRAKLEAIIINNIISFCKFAGYTVQERLTVKGNFRPLPANLKGKVHLAFLGGFTVNFLLPHLLGLGKSTSRGYGSIKKTDKI